MIALVVMVSAGVRDLRAQDSWQEKMEQEVEQLKSQVSALESELAAAEGLGENTFRVYWKDGLRLDTADKAFRAKIGGRIQNDWLFWGDRGDELKDEFDLENGVEFRRARLYIQGEIYEHVEFKAQYDFAGGDADFKDVYLGLTGLAGIGGVRLGHFKEPFSLEELTSSKYITFLERALPVSAFAPSRNTGIMVHNHAMEERMTWAAGVFMDTDDFGDNLGDDWNVTGRITGLPWYEEEGAKLLHLGAAYTYKNPDDSELRFRTRPEIHNTDRFVDTDDLAADDAGILGLEAATVLGPLSFQGEYLYNSVCSDGGDDSDLDGWYVQASYFLTGESRRYKRSTGTFDRTKPNRNFLDGEGGMGAWEVAGRYSTVDLSDGDADGGEEDNVTLALNWYLNPNTRVMFNYVFIDVDSPDVDDDASAALMRFQVDF
jgi:phosphate-selective porin OprO/OprP